MFKGTGLDRIKQSDEALKQSERRLADIIDFMPAATLAIDLEGKVIVWNKSMEILTGVKAEEMLGKDNYESSVPLYSFRRPMLVDMILMPSPNFEAEYMNFQRGENAVMGEVFIPSLGPRGSYLLAKAAALYNAQGDLVGAIESIIDMTERKLMEQRLERTRTELSIAAEIQKSFTPGKPPEIPRFEIAAVSRTAMEVGGD